MTPAPFRDFLALAVRYEKIARAYLAPGYRPRVSLRLDVLAHCLRIGERDRSALLLALVAQKSDRFTPAHARQVARFCPAF